MTAKLARHQVVKMSAITRLKPPTFDEKIWKRSVGSLIPLHAGFDQFAIMLRLNQACLQRDDTIKEATISIHNK